MSTYYGYFCEDCDKHSPHGFRNSAQAASDLYYSLPALDALMIDSPLMKGEHYFAFEMRYNWDDAGEMLDFLREHREHSLRVADEYGRLWGQLDPPPVGT